MLMGRLLPLPRQKHNRATQSDATASTPTRRYAGLAAADEDLNPEE
jgi:hypothetical protein